jgi:hypothetical protein
MLTGKNCIEQEGMTSGKNDYAERIWARLQPKNGRFVYIIASG